jgi:hypothetical protein
MEIDRSEWGVRLSDRVRAALSAGDIAVARRLVAEGDGMAKNLEKEYSLMAKGLGVSIRALLDLLDDAARRATDEGRQALSETLRRFCGDIEKLARCDEDPEPIDLSGWFSLARRRLAEAETHFDREHGNLARLILEALDRRDGAAARELVDLKERSEFVPLHDRLVRFMAEVWAWVLEHLGAEELRRFHRGAAEAQRRGFEAWERLPAEGFARATAFLVRQHMGDTTILEDDEKFRFVLSPCGSGGRLRRAGAYDGPDALPHVEERGPLTFGKPRLAVYCSHCPMWNSVASAMWFGHPQWVYHDPSRSDGSCTVSIYKRPENIPGAYLQRLGLRDRP